MVMLVVFSAFVLIAAIFGSIGLYAFLTSTRPNDAIIILGGFGWIFLTVTLYLLLTFHRETKPGQETGSKTKKPYESPALISAVAVSGFLLGIAGLILYFYGRVTFMGMIFSLMEGLFLMLFAWIFWANHVKKNYG